MPSYHITVKAEGPLFDGRAVAASHEFLNKATQRLAETGRDWIMIDANAMDRSGRGGTGRAAAGVLIYDRGDGRAIFGEMNAGQVWWPWLEGTSKRNRSTRFGGYHTFRKTRQRLADHLQDIVRPLLDEFLAKIGGR